MSAWNNRRRSTRTALLVALALTAVGGTALIGIASASTPNMIELRTGGTSAAAFVYGDTPPQQLTYNKNQCKLDDAATVNGEIIKVTGTSLDKKGDAAAGQIGLVEDGIGVNYRSNGNAQDCGRTDFINAKAEVLHLALGSRPIADRKLINRVDLDFEAKYTAFVEIQFMRGTDPLVTVGPIELSSTSSSDAGPDSKYLDKYKLVCTTNGCVLGDEDPPAPGELFTEVIIRPTSGAVALEGGATWPTPTNHRTVFYLTTVDPKINIEVTPDGDDIIVGDTPTNVTWVYTVTNPGTTALTGVTVTDPDRSPTSFSKTDNTGADDPTPSSLDPGDIWVWRVVEQAQAPSDGTVAVSATGTATGTPLIGSNISDTDGGSYFGVDADISLTVLNENQVVPVDSAVTWDFSAMNTGNVPLTGTIVQEITSASGETTYIDICNIAGVLQPGATLTCSGTTAPQTAEGETTITFRVKADYLNSAGDLIDTVDITVGPVDYYVGYACKDISEFDGGPDIDDNPLAAFYVGPSTKDPECAIPIEVSATYNTEGAQQVFVGPPAGYTWDELGVTGIITVEWDIEPAGTDPVARTKTINTSEQLVEIPWCHEIVKVKPTIVEIQTGVYKVFYELFDPEAVYDQATEEGFGVCLINQTSAVVLDGFTQTTETYYVYNDPYLIR